jgi:hypothetical protein
VADPVDFSHHHAKIGNMFKQVGDNDQIDRMIRKREDRARGVQKCDVGKMLLRISEESFGDIQPVALPDVEMFPDMIQQETFRASYFQYALKYSARTSECFEEPGLPLKFVRAVFSIEYLHGPGVVIETCHFTASRSCRKSIHVEGGLRQG